MMSFAMLRAPALPSHHPQRVISGVKIIRRQLAGGPEEDPWRCGRSVDARSAKIPFDNCVVAF